MLWWTHVTNLILGRLTHTKWTITPLGMQVLHPFEVKFMESVIWRPLVPIVSQKKGPPRQEWCQRILQSYRSKIVAKIVVQFSSYRIHTFCFTPTYPQNGAVHSYSVAAGKVIIGYHSCMEIILIGGSEHHAMNGLMRELTLWDLIGLGELSAVLSRNLDPW